MSPAIPGPRCLAADSDGDGFDDDGRFGPRQPIAVMAMGPTSAAAADLDGDGDLDVLTTSFADDTTAWYENLDGAGSFGGKQTITTATDGPSYVVAGDLDGDDDLDVVTASSNDSTIAWHENTDGQGTFGSGQTITSTALGAIGVAAADLDGDGDSDLIVASGPDDTIGWLENLDGLGSFGLAQPIVTDATSARSGEGVDLDGDGDLDVLTVVHFDHSVEWHENLGPADNCPGVPNPDQADSDGDGIGNACDTSIPALPAAWLPVAFLGMLAGTVRRGASAPSRRSPERPSAGH